LQSKGLRPFRVLNRASFSRPLPTLRAARRTWSAAGASYTLPESKMTFNLEYDYNQAVFYF